MTLAAEEVILSLDETCTAGPFTDVHNAVQTHRQDKHRLRPIKHSAGVLPPYVHMFFAGRFA